MKQITRKQFFQRFTGGLLALGATAIGKDVDSKPKPITIYQGGLEPVGSVYHAIDGVHIRTGKGEYDWELLPAPSHNADIAQIIAEARDRMGGITG